MIPVIGYKNLLENGTVVASSQNADFPVANLYDWLTCDFFKPAATGTINIDLTLGTAASADYFAFYNHNLHTTGGTIKLQYWNGSTYVDCFSAITPTDNAPQMVKFASQTATLWRIVVTCTSICSIAVASFGQSLTLERGRYLGWTFPKFGRSTQVIDSTSDGGEFIGRSVVSNGVRTSLEINKASDAWMRANWMGLVEHIETKPFFYLPDSDGHPSESVFCFTDGDIPTPSQSDYGHMTVSIPIRGMVE